MKSPGGIDPQYSVDVFTPSPLVGLICFSCGHFEGQIIGGHLDYEKS